MYELVPRRVAKAVKQGKQRIKHHRKTRAMFIRAYVGQYFADTHGITGDTPINLVYNAIRATVPQYVMRDPITEVHSDIVEYDDYAFLLGKALDSNNRRTKKKFTLRYGLVDSFFSIGIFKTALADSDSFVRYGDKRIDPGMVFTDNVSLDDFVADPDCKSFDRAAFTGDMVRVPRQLLLDNDSFDHDLVMKIPRSNHPDSKNRVDNMTKSGLTDNEVARLEDHVDIYYLYVPDADAILVMPDPDTVVLDDYLAVHDYYGPKDGPYTFMSLSQPVPDNPFPIAPVGVWYDLNKMANKMMVKTMEQAERQKSVLLADPAAADEVEDLRTSEDGDVLMGDPKNASVFNFGGKDRDTEGFVDSLRVWFNYMSGNPDQMAGVAGNAKTATQSQILAGNAAVGLEDGKDMTYDTASAISEKEAWYMHHDPLINIPIPHRVSGGTRVQLQLTPEQRRGQPEDFIFKIKARSMQVKDPHLLAQQLENFMSRTLPSTVQAGMQMMQMGIPFNVSKALMDVADKAGILEEIADWFDDPDFQRRIQMMQMLGPQGEMKAGMASPGAIAQNGGPANAKAGGPTSPMQDQKAGEQAIANISQSAMKG